MLVFKRIMALTLACALTLSMGAVMALAEDGGVGEAAQVNVVGQSEENTDKVPLELSVTGRQTLKMGETTTIKVTTPGLSSVEWVYNEAAKHVVDPVPSENSLELTVTGRIKNRTVQLVARHPDYADTVCEIRVVDNPTSSILLDSTGFTVQVGDTCTIKASVIGPSAVKWTSYDESIATVKASDDDETTATINAVGAGITKVEVQSEDGSMRDFCTIEVVERGGMYVSPGTRVLLEHSLFKKESDDTQLVDMEPGFYADYFKVTSKISNGADLVNIYIDDKYDETSGSVMVGFKQNDNLIVPNKPNVIIDEIKLTAQKDLDGYFVKGDTFVFRTSYKVGYRQLDVPLSSDGVEYLPDMISNFVESDDVTSGTASYWDGNMLYLEGDVRAGDKVMLSVNNEETEELIAHYPDIPMQFINIRLHNDASSNIKVRIMAKENQYIYKIADGKVMTANMKWDSVNLAWSETITDDAFYVVTSDELEPVAPSGNADLTKLYYSVDGSENIEVPGFVYNKTNYTVSLNSEFKSAKIIGEKRDAGATLDNSKATATPESSAASVKVTSSDGKRSNTYTVNFKVEPKDDGDDDDNNGGNNGNDNSGSNSNGGSNNAANTTQTVDKVTDTIEALKNPAAALPADVTKTTTATGATIATIPVSMTSGSATVGLDLFNNLGTAPANVGVKFSVSAGLTGGSMEVIVPGGFGKITEPGRLGYSMDYSPKAENNDKMLNAVKGENVTSTTAKIGGNHTLPVEATITVATKVVNGVTVNIYKYDPWTNKMIVVGKAVAKDGKLTFNTKLMGEMLFTTGTI